MVLKSVYFTIEGTDGIFTVEKKASVFFSSADPLYIQAHIKDVADALKKDISAFAKRGRMSVNLFGYDENYKAVDGFRYVYQWDGEVTYREWNPNQGCYAETSVKKYIKKDGIDFAKMTREIMKTLEADAMRFIVKHGMVDYEYAK